MFCGHCGTPNSEESKFCGKCGSPLPLGAGQTTQVSAEPGLPPAGFVSPPTTSGKAVASLILGFLFFFFPAALAAVIFGHLSLSDIRKSAGRLEGHGIAVAGLVLGYLGLLMVPLLLILAAIAIPNFMHARTAANQASAVGSLRSIDTAAMAYSSTYGNGFPPDLQTLGGFGGSSCDHAGLIDGLIASGVKRGYSFTYQIASGHKAAASGCSAPGGDHFSVTARPLVQGRTGEDSYYEDETGVIRREHNGIATAESEPLE